MHRMIEAGRGGRTKQDASAWHAMAAATALEYEEPVSEVEQYLPVTLDQLKPHCARATVGSSAAARAAVSRRPGCMSVAEGKGGVLDQY